ncbi:MAG: hypothetical protein PVF19_08285, partial [Gemmatimonadota bacterium]
MSAARRRRSPAGARTASDATRAREHPTSRNVLYLPLALTGLLGLLSFMPRVQDNSRLTWSFWGAIAILLVWQALLYLRLKGEDEGRSFTTVLRKQHYIQGLVQVAVFA